MLKEISKYLMDKIQHFPSSDKILFNNKQIEINKNNFTVVTSCVDPARNPDFLVRISGRFFI